jgi:peroxiredoxin
MLGEPHPEFTLPDIATGKPVSLSDYRGKKVLLIQFASWWAGCRRHVPVWHDLTRQLVNDNKLVVLGVTQEQHPERCRLFAQWKQFDWPILHDPINVLETSAVPVVVAIDEQGVVRSTRPQPQSFEKEFIDKTL